MTRRLASRSAWYAAAGLLPGCHRRPDPAAFPTKTIRIIVPFPAQAVLPTPSRAIVAEKLNAEVGSAGIIVENKSGAGGNIRADSRARRSPDGNTFPGVPARPDRDQPPPVQVA